MVSIARKNLLYDKGRLVITLLGIGTVLVMALVGLGMGVGTISGMQLIFKNTKADVWVMQQGNRDIMNPSVIQDGSIKEIKEVDGVKSVRKVIASQAKAKDGSKEFYVYLFGTEPYSDIASEWAIDRNYVESLKSSDTIILDRSSELVLGDSVKGGTLKLNGIKQTIVGTSEGAKNFIYPYAFTSLDNARKISGMKPGTSSYAVVTLKAGAEAGDVASDISKVKDVDAYTSEQASANTADYMLFQSGMGIGIGIMTLIGLIVAAIIISLTVYTETAERIPEFGTLKAIGATRKDIYAILISQVVISSSIGFLLGVAMSFAVTVLFKKITLMPVVITWPSVVWLYTATVLLSILGSFMSVRKVNKVDPAIVFRA